MYSLRTRDDPQDQYLYRSSLAHHPDESNRIYAQSHAIPRSNPYIGSSSDDLTGHYGQRRYASASPANRFQDHMDYSIPQALPAMSTGISRIDTQFTRRDAPLTNTEPLSASSVDINANSEAWSPTHTTKPRKTRREKPRIELAPDQPPTTQGKPRARVYVACLQCRTRKIRCDGAKPVCHNCGKRASGNTECNYDPLPKRRGPDKTPGARQRVARREGGPRTRRRTSSSDAQDYMPNKSGSQPQQPFSFPSPTSSEQSREEYIMSPQVEPPFLPTCACHGLPQCPSSQVAGVREHQIPVPLNNSLNILASPPETPVSPALISDYEESDNELHRKNKNPRVLTIVGQPTLDFSRKTGYWFSFLHIPNFFFNFHEPSKRDLIQPSLILAALALAFSGKVPRSARDSADESVHSSAERHGSKSQCRMGERHPSLGSMAFYFDLLARKVPAVSDGTTVPGPQHHSYSYLSSLPISGDRGCSCNSLTLKEQWPEAFEQTPLWAQAPAWFPSWSDAEIRRRLFAD
ncbi:hypothetical protein B0H12DRAFT_1220855, partial [Mycena haematopus]